MTERDPTLFYLSVVVLMELEYGICLVERRDARQGHLLRSWLQQAVLPGFADRVLNFTPGIAGRCAALQARRPAGLADAMIAATALEHRMVAVTRNVGDSAEAGVEIINPWEGPA